MAFQAFFTHEPTYNSLLEVLPEPLSLYDFLQVNTKQYALECI